MDFINEQIVVTRKPHKCWGCTTEFPQGSKLVRKTNSDGGEIFSSYWCAKCEEWMAKNYRDVPDGICFGDLKEEVLPHPTTDGKGEL